MQKHNSQAGGAHIIIIVGVVIVLLGALGYVFWNNSINKKEAVVPQVENKPAAKEFCAPGENVAAEKGTFCSEDMRIKFTVPGIFVDKLAKIDNYPVFEGPLDPHAKKSAGTSELAYQAKITGNDNFTLTIAKEPLRTGYVDVPHLLQGTYFDQATGELTRVNMPTLNYDSRTGTYAQSGEDTKGEAVPSFVVDDVRFYRGTNGDAGITENVYFAVINNKIVKISLKHQGYMGDPAKDPTTIDADKVFEELDKAIKTIKVNRP